MSAVKRVALVLLYAIPPVFAALYAGATEVANGSFVPWRPNMVDLDVYIRSAELVLQGEDFYNVDAWLPFIYPPFAALLATPLALLGQVGSQVFWLILNALLVMVVVYRLGFKNWRLSLVATAAIWLIEPIRRTLGFGQVNIVLMALIVIDLMPGPRLLSHRRRVLPEGWLTGVAAAIKLTPAIFTVYLLLVGRFRAALVSFLSFLAAAAIGWILLPGPSVDFWGRLVGGDSGLNTGLKHYTNQSLIGAYVRFTKELPDSIPLPGLALSAIVILIGLLAALLWHERGHPSLAICLTMITALMASPISWSHHFTWILPLAIIMVKDKGIPDGLRYFGLVFSIWVMYAPFMQFLDDEQELTYSWGVQLIDAGSMLLGIGFLSTLTVVALLDRRRLGQPLIPWHIPRRPTPRRPEHEVSET